MWYLNWEMELWYELLEAYVVDENILQCICALDWILKYMLLMKICAIMIKCGDVLLRLCLVFLLMRICAIWIEEWIGVVELSMHGSKLWNMIVMRLSWDDDQMMLRWNVKLWILARSQLSSSSLLIKFWWIWWMWNESNPKKAGTPACEKLWGGDSRKWKREWAGTPAIEKRLWGGDSRKKKKCMWRGLPQEKKKKRMGGDSHKKKKRMAGTPAREKEMYMEETPANEWWYGGDSHKKRAGTPAMNGIANLISKRERGGNWHHAV